MTARFLVNIDMVGIPDHAWCRASAETLLSPFCDIIEVSPETETMADMAVFRLSTWTLNPDAIPRLSELLLPVSDDALANADPNMVLHFGAPPPALSSLYSCLQLGGLPSAGGALSVPAPRRRRRVRAPITARSAPLSAAS